MEAWEVLAASWTDPGDNGGTRLLQRGGAVLKGGRDLQPQVSPAGVTILLLSPRLLWNTCVREGIGRATTAGEGRGTEEV